MVAFAGYVTAAEPIGFVILRSGLSDILARREVMPYALGFAGNAMPSKAPAAPIDAGRKMFPAVSQATRNGVSYEELPPEMAHRMLPLVSDFAKKKP